MPEGRRIPRTEDVRGPRPTAPAAAEPLGPEAQAVAAAGAELAALVRPIRACEACRRAAPARAFGSGYPRAPVMLLKERPSHDDLRTGAAFTTEGEAMQLAFGSLGIPFSWAYATTAVRCGSARTTDGEVEACGSHLLVEIEVVRPAVIVAFGPRAAAAVVALDGRCGIEIPAPPARGEPAAIRPGTALLVTEPLPEGVEDAQAKRRLWKDLKTLPDLLGR